MGRIERWVFRTWIVVSALAGIAMFMGGLLIILSFAIVTIPIVMLAYHMPTVWLYLTPALMLYATLRLLLRRTSVPRFLLGLLAAAPPITAGYLIAAHANDEIERQVAAIMKDDFGKEPYLEPVDTVAFLQDKGFLQTDGKPDFKCWD